MKKEEVRKEFLQKRLDLSDTELKKREQAVSRSFESFDFSGFRMVHIFLSISERREINTFSLIAWLRDTHPDREIVVPKLVPGEQKFINLVLEPNAALEYNKWGIPEPLSGLEVMPGDIDLVIVPLLAVDTQGHRVGYGKGFYDRFLKSCRRSCRFIGLSLFEPVEPCWDADAFDIPLHGCISPEGLTFFAKPQASA